MTTETILSWANTWRSLCDLNVPIFVDVDRNPDLTPDIRVNFNGETN